MRFILSAIFCGAWLFLSGPASGQTDENFNALYGGYGVPISYVAPELVWHWDTYTENNTEGVRLQKKLREDLFDIAKEIFKSEFGVTVRDFNLLEDKVSQKHQKEVMYLRLIMSTKVTNTAEGSLVVANIQPTFGRPGIGLTYPYHTYAASELFVVKKNDKELENQFRKSARVILTGEAKRIICSKDINRTKKFCSRNAAVDDLRP